MIPALVSVAASVAATVVATVVVAFPDCGGFWLLCIGLFCFVDCCCVFVALVGAVEVVLVLDCVVVVV